MTFTSPEFVVFFAAFVPLYFALAHRFRWILLLAASYFFYAYGSGIAVLLIVFSTLVDYAAGRDSRRRDGRSLDQGPAVSAGASGRERESIASNRRSRPNRNR